MYDIPFLHQPTPLTTDYFQIWVAGVDDVLTQNGLISPGLGDTVSSPTYSHRRPSLHSRSHASKHRLMCLQGDRLFSTVRP